MKFTSCKVKCTKSTFLFYAHTTHSTERIYVIYDETSATHASNNPACTTASVVVQMLAHVFVKVLRECEKIWGTYSSTS